MRISRVVVIALLLALPVVSQAAIIYSGSLQTTTGVTATGAWQNNFKISWRIENVGPADWLYEYWLTELDGTAMSPGAVSHWIVEISPDATAQDFWGFDGSPWSIATFGPAPSNPNIPGSFYALKLDYGSSGQTKWSFHSRRAPTWGDFYAKNGKTGGVDNTAWNADFLLTDPTNPAQNGLLAKPTGGFYQKILRPDTNIPEPTTLLLMGGSALAALLPRRRFGIRM